MIVRGAEIIFDVPGGEAAIPPQRLPIRRRADRRERAGGRAEDRRGRIGTGHRGRHAEGGLIVAGCALAHAAVDLARPRVLLALQYLDEGLVGGLQGITRQQRAIVVYGHGDLPGADSSLFEGRGPASAVSDPAADRILAVLSVGFDLDGTLRFLVRLVLRRDHR